MFRKTGSFVARVIRSAFHRVTSFGRDCVTHTEAVVLLGAASIGINSMMSTVPISVALPAIVNPAMVIPVVAVVTTVLLVKSAEFRATHRRPRLHSVPSMAAAA